MDMNRNQFFMIGLIFLFLGIQFRFVDSFVLNAKASKFIAEKTKKMEPPKANASEPGLLMTGGGPSLGLGKGPTALRSVKPPIWLGWALMSVGSVFVLHSLAMKKPD